MSDAQRGLQDCEDCIEPAEAFAVIGNETRLSILEALWDAEEKRVSFSDLRKAVGMRDSAQFNYHLDKLVGQFVRKTDDGYEFRHAGQAVIRAVQSGTVHEDPELDPFGAPGDCVDCGGDLTARYRNEKLCIRCRDCDRRHVDYTFPPGGLEDRTLDEVVDAFDQRLRHLHCLAADGVCHECNGRMETTIVEDPEGLELDVAVRHQCQRCRYELCTSAGMVLLDHAAVVTFYGDHGVDLNDRYCWDLAWCVSDRHTTVTSTDPWQFELAIPVDDERLVVTLDEDLTVVETTRESDGPTGARSAA